MKIGMMAAWNQTSGVSIHAEFVGREWVRAGHKLRVFSFLEEDFHGHSLIGVDEEYVIRCFGTPVRSNYLNAIPFLTEDYDFFVVQDLGMLPRNKLALIFPLIKRKAKTILIVHANKLTDDPSFYQFDWDALVCFDHRYESFLKGIYQEEKVHTVPFPCHRRIEEDQEEARRKLKLPLDKKIVFVFGQKWRNMLDTVPAIAELSEEYPLHLLVFSGVQRIEGIERLKRITVTSKEVLEQERIYDYLHAADATIFGKSSKEGAVVSSTAHLILGSGCPIVARDSNFFEMMDKEVLKYRNPKEFKDCLVSAFEKDEKYETCRKAARKYTEENSSQKIARDLVELFRKL